MKKKYIFFSFVENPKRMFKIESGHCTLKHIII